MKKKVREVYGALSDVYNKRYEGRTGGFFRYEESLFWENLSPAEGNRILDLGAGTGRFAEGSINKKAFYVGIDFSKMMIKVAKKTYSGVKNIEFMVADAENLPFRPSSFDKVISIGMFEYISQPKRILSEINIILESKGVMCANVWNKMGLFRLPLAFVGSLRRTTNFKRAPFQANEFRHHLENSGFKIRAVKGYFFIPPMLLLGNVLGWFFPCSVLKKLDQKALLRNAASSLLFSASKV